MTDQYTTNAGSHDCVLLAVLAKIEALEALIVRAHNAQMRNIDEETSALSQQIAAITTDQAGQVSAEQIEKLRAIAGRLDAIGKLTPNS